MENISEILIYHAVVIYLRTAVVRNGIQSFLIFSFLYCLLLKVQNHIDSGYVSRIYHYIFFRNTNSTLRVKPVRLQCCILIIEILTMPALQCIFHIYLHMAPERDGTLTG